MATQIAEVYGTGEAESENVALVPGWKIVKMLREQKDAIDEAMAVVIQGVILADAYVRSKQEGIEVRRALEAVRAKMSSLKKDVDDRYALHAASTVPAVAVESAVRMMFSNAAALSEMERHVKDLNGMHPDVSYILDDLADVLREKVAIVNSAVTEMFGENEASGDELDNAAVEEFTARVDDAITAMLLSFQALMSIDETAAPNGTTNGVCDDEDDAFGLRKRYLIDAHQRTVNLFRSGHLGNVLEAFNSLLSGVHMDTQSIQSRRYFASLVRRIYPLFNQYLLAVRRSLLDCILQHKSMLKFAYILCNTFGQLYKDGFCVPRDEKDDGADDDTTMEDNVAGTGIGEGEGNKDVSDEIENEDQVEGMQNEAPAKPDPQKKIDDEENGIEMDTDFDGKLEDVDAEDEEEDDARDNEEESEEPEEQMGDVDGNANVVDEKLWGDDDKDEDVNGQDEKTERDAPAQDGGGETEMAAKEGGGNDEEESSDRQEREDNQRQEAQQNVEPQNANEDGEEDSNEDIINEDNEAKYEDSHGIDPKAADEKEQQEQEEEDDMELPDDMDMDANEQEEDDRDGGRDQSADRMDLNSSEDMNHGNEESLEEEKDEETNNVEEEKQPDEAAAEEAQQEGSETLEPEALAEQEEQNTEQGPEVEVEKNNIQENRESAHEEQEPEKPDSEQSPEDATQAVDDQIQSSTQPYGVKGASGEKSALNVQPDEMSEEIPEDGENGSANEDFTPGAEKSQRRSQHSRNEGRDKSRKDENMDPNPRRSLGDALKKWMSRLKNISESTEEEKTNREEFNDEPLLDGDKALEYEFVKEDDEAADAQAMADATADQFEEMDRKALADDKEEKECGTDDAMDVEEHQEDVPDEQGTTSREPDAQKKGRSENPSGAIDLGLNEKDGKEVENKVRNDEEDVGGVDTMDVDEEEVDDIEWTRPRALNEGDTLADDEADESTLMDSHQYDELRLELEQSVAAWRESGQDPREAEELWRNYTALTRDLSFALCEQLRLILEPTLATKLKGDYRTGKRLNMRKIIPYIASQFKKDKIWLRRTKPSKRTYQIMIAIDDSRSMAESRSVQLAYESLAVITKALTQLEAGDVSVLSFGEDVKLLHPFDRPFSDDAGADVIRRFTFKQDRTHVRKMMETAMGILDHARTQSGAGPGSDLWQLQLVISDGICEDHELVQALVRKAAEQRIMVVFIVLDNRREKDSITKMTNVTYGVDLSTGRPTLQMSRYMDTFPFDYYVVVKDIGTLPEVLADTLRQYFMFVNA
ncbi:uncharacterized protein SPPG_08935 [Spizellomyces punctatus DAOM BR117]|uniref:VWFA domain-containing protein n=1 Tax=Spizellomyces punctatus (strain DAOM BR117) TaxID=645134 RepID=A0A0L0HRF9_SPIPD|nr:uncharacterized protein SPPG_08935 [Spizellomyces punctatus DAOM BR117]KND03961.1 hypothetical protein SPPG_08935 [Spizellomyces punctatus DAOM BR117]|eukprot:XP_016612000.1 hypothetical protein SPPG_08935 [Spizellomyces punctatus DAOM BR117]